MQCCAPTVEPVPGNSWEIAQSRNAAVTDFGATFLHGKLYAVGGSRTLGPLHERVDAGASFSFVKSKPSQASGCTLIGCLRCGASLNLEHAYIFAFIGSEGASKLIWIFHDLFSSSLSSTFKTFSIASCVLR